MYSIHQRPNTIWSRLYDRVIHQVQIIDGTPLHQLLQVTELGVNSYHHQAVKLLRHR